MKLYFVLFFGTQGDGPSLIRIFWIEKAFSERKISDSNYCESLRYDKVNEWKNKNTKNGENEIR